MGKHKGKGVRYNEVIRKYEEYFSVSYYESYLEFLRFKQGLKDSYKTLVSSLSLQTVKQNKALQSMYKEIEKLNATTSRIEYYNKESRQVFRDLFEYVDKDSLYNNYNLDIGIGKAPPKYGERILRALSKEFDKLLQENADFRSLVIVILFSIKGSKFYLPLVMSDLNERRIKQNKTSKEILETYKELQEYKEKRGYNDG